MRNEIQFILYHLPDEEGKVQVVIKDETIWATQKAMAQLFGCSTDNISLHLKNIFATGELPKESVTEKISATAADGKNYLTQFYALDSFVHKALRLSGFILSLLHFVLPPLAICISTLKQNGKCNRILQNYQTPEQVPEQVVSKYPNKSRTCCIQAMP